MPKLEKRTCGPMYLEALTQYAGSDPAMQRAFAAGFINGQAEKVHLGACRAAMARPSPETRQMVIGLITDACVRYGLYGFVRVGDELWMCRDHKAAQQVERLLGMQPDTAMWHVLRGHLCGVPPSEIDTSFHCRRGYGEVCDRVAPVDLQPAAIPAG